MLSIFGLFLGKSRKHIIALAFYPFIFVSKDTILTPELINHERIHLRQQIEMLILPFYIWYIVEYFVWRIKGLKHVQAYLEISFEKEAYANQGNLEYLKKRKSWNFLNYLRK
jgi:hypothetical protein